MTMPEDPFTEMALSAMHMHEFKQSLVDAGFSDQEAMDVLKTTIQATIISTRGETE